MKHTDVTTLPQVSQLKLDLIAAKGLIDSPEKWCRLAVHQVAADGTDQFCSYGAVLWATPSRWHDAARALRQAIDGQSVATYNNSRTHAEVMAMFDAAIERV